MKKIGIVGIGFMGSAVARAIRRGEEEVSISIVEKDPVRRDVAIREFGASDYTDQPAQLMDSCDLVVLAVKPQDLATSAAALRGSRNQPPILSVLAGTTIETLARKFESDRIVRIMPNLAASIGRAVIGMSVGPGIQGADRTLCRSVIDPMGTILEVPEETLGAITGLSGSGIAFAFSFIHSLALGGVAEGIPYATALSGATEVVASAAALMAEGNIHPEEMVSRVASPGGTTIAGLTELYERSFTATVIAAVNAAAERSREIES